MIPGINLLGLALSVITPQSVDYLKSTGRTQTAGTGRWIAQYAAAVPVNNGSVQAISRDSYAELGLDLARNYVEWIAPIDGVDVKRDGSGDMIEWNAKQWQLISQEDWLQQDGWKIFIGVEVGPSA